MNLESLGIECKSGVTFFVTMTLNDKVLLVVRKGETRPLWLALNVDEAVQLSGALKFAARDARKFTADSRRRTTARRASRRVREHTHEAAR